MYKRQAPVTVVDAALGSASATGLRLASWMFRANSLAIDQRVRASVSRMESVAMMGIPSYSVGMDAMAG